MFTILAVVAAVLLTVVVTNRINQKKNLAQHAVYQDAMHREFTLGFDGGWDAGMEQGARNQRLIDMGVTTQN